MTQGSDHEPYVCHATGNGCDTVLRILRSTKEHNLIGYSIKSPEKSWMEMMVDKEIWEKE